MIHPMPARIAALIACLLLASAAAAETVYKYRRADGRTVYSNRLVPGLELIETFEYRFAEPAPAAKDEARNAAEADARIKKYLAALQAAWSEVQAATKALATAEQRLRAGVEPQLGEREGVATGNAPSAVGGVPSASPPAAGGSLSGQRVRGSPEYYARIQALEADVSAARDRLDAALRRYNELR